MANASTADDLDTDALLFRTRSLRWDIHRLDAERAKRAEELDSVTADLRNRTRDRAPRSLCPKELEILHALVDSWRQPLSAVALADIVGQSEMDAKKNLNLLLRRGLIFSTQTRPALYQVAPAVVRPSEVHPRGRRRPSAKEAVPCS